MFRKDIDAVKGLETHLYDRLHSLWQIEHYRSLSPFYLTRKRLINKLIVSRVKTRIHVLDIGCGIGDLLATFPSALTSVGIDVSNQALRIASQRNRNASFSVADARALPFKSRFFDLAICSEVLEHLDEDDEAVAEISRILKNKGVACFTGPQNPRYWTNEDAFDGHLRRYDVIEFSRMLRSQQLRTEDLLSWGFPLALLFREYISTRIFNVGLHGPLTRGKARAIRIIANFLKNLFRFDDLFSWLNLGLGIVAVARRTPAS